MTIKHIAAFALASILAGGLARPAFAGGGDEDREALALQGSKLTLSQAISTAEQQTSGKAFDAGVNIENGKPQIVVETNGPKGVFTVRVDVQTGAVIGTHAGGEAD